MAETIVSTPPNTEVGSTPHNRQHRFTQEEYFRMSEEDILDPDGRTELIDGRIVEMVAQNSSHRAVIIDGTKILVDLVRDTEYSVQVQSTLPLDAHNVPEPDFVIISGTGKDLLDGEPDEIPLIIEVAETSLAKDRTEKLVCYASNGIPEYWIVNLQAHTLEVYREPADGEYRERRTFAPGDAVTPLFDETLAIEVEDLLPRAE